MNIDTPLLTFISLILISLVIISFVASVMALVRREQKRRARSEMSLLRYDHIVNAGGLGVWELNLLTGALYIDPQAKAMLGYDDAALPDTLEAFYALIPPDDLPRVQAQFDSFLQNPVGRYEIEYPIRHRDGHLLTLLTRGIAQPDKARHGAQGRPERVLFVCIDITERKSHEENVMSAERQRVALELERQKVQMMGDIFRDLSHDFRTPLSVINTGVYLMERAETSEQRSQRARIIEGQTERLSKMLDALFMLVRLDMTRQLTLSPVNVAMLVRDIFYEIEEAVAAKTLNLTFTIQDEKLKVLSNSTELGFALRSLLDNAVEYTPPGGDIAVSAWADDGNVIIAVRDMGVGISDEDLPHIFDRMFRADRARSPETGGAGLGLSIAQRIVDLHGGRIDVESTPNQGSTFTIRLPQTSHVRPMR